MKPFYELTLGGVTPFYIDFTLKELELLLLLCILMEKK